MTWPEVAGALFGGLAIGFLYFGGLWWTVNHLNGAKRPVAFYLASFAARLAMVVVCVVLVLQVATSQLVIAVVGFFAARLVLVYISSHPRSSKIDAGAIR